MSASNRVDLAFGKGHLSVTLPAHARVEVIRKRPLPKLADPRAAIRAALDAPVGAPPLRQLAAGRRSACRTTTPGC